MPPTIYLDSLGSIGSPGGQMRSGGPQFSLADVESDADWRSGLNKRYRDEIAGINAVPDRYDVARKAERDAFQHEQAMPADPNRLAAFSPGLRGVDSLSNAELGNLEVGQFQAGEQAKRAQDLERIKQQDDMYKLRQLEDYRIMKLKQDAALSAANNQSREKVATIREGDGGDGGGMSALLGETSPRAPAGEIGQAAGNPDSNPDTLSGYHPAQMPSPQQSFGAPRGPGLRERRVINGRLGEWDGMGWKAVQ